jgi:Chlorophyll A-B binding protein
MTKLSVALALALAASASAFVPQTSSVKTSSLASWDPLSFGELSTGKSFDTFPTMFPDKQYLQESEIKQGRMSMLAWTGIWATHQVGYRETKKICIGNTLMLNRYAGWIGTWHAFSRCPC